MDDNSSFEESNFYTNAVKRFLDSDDEDIPIVKPEEKNIAAKVPLSAIESSDELESLPLKTRAARRRERRQTPSQYSRGRPKRKTCSSYQRSESLNSETEVLNIVEINDSCSPPQETNWNEFNADEGEIIWQSEKSTDDILKDVSIDADISIPCIDVDDDLEVAIHVKWKLQASNAIYLKKTETMKQVFQHWAQEKGVPEDQIQLMYKGKLVSPYDTPEKFNSTVVILEGRLKAGTNSGPPQEEKDPNQIELKILTKDKKEKLTVCIFRNEPFEVFMEKTAQLMGHPRSVLSFKFDGESIDSSETPESLDLEDGECIEVFVRS